MPTIYRLELLKPLKKGDIYQGLFVADRLTVLRKRIQALFPVSDESPFSWAADWTGYAFDTCPNPDSDSAIATAWSMAANRGTQSKYLFAFPSKDSLIECCGIFQDIAFLQQFEASFGFGLRIRELFVKHCVAGSLQAIFMEQDILQEKLHFDMNSF